MYNNSNIIHCYHRSMDFCNLCTRVFDRQDKNTMKFDDFIQCCVMLRSLTESFKRLDTNRSGIISINYETVSHWKRNIIFCNVLHIWTIRAIPTYRVG